MKKTILILSIMALIFTSCKRDEILNEGDKWHNGHAAVDLGLPSGLYWATCNIGASSTEGYGDYYAWGETSVKKYYSEENSETYMSRINDISGDAQYDAARANWGGQWRMPTKYEMQELQNECKWTWVEGPVEGYEITGPNGNSIFLPAAGAKYDYGDINKGYASYWTSKPYKGDTGNEVYNIAHAYGYYSVQDDFYPFGKHEGLTIRPVFGGKVKPVGIDARSRYVEDLTATTARFSIGAIQEENYIIEAYGACWSTNAKPTIDDYHCTFYEYADPDNDGEILGDVYLENLMPNTKYYIRAFATHNGVVVYGEVMSFMTLPEESGQEHGRTYIDLGLPSGLKWAMYNFGSSDYYAWGDEDWKDTYEAGNCNTYGIEMNDISGSEYDPVQRSWGGQWRMPTVYEMQELVENCSWEWVSEHHYDDALSEYVNPGYKVTGPNGNSIYLPVRGYRESVEYYHRDERGYYWTSMPYYDGNNHHAYCLEFGSEDVQISPNWRYYGLNIRPVMGYNEALYPTVRMNYVTDITTNSAKCSAYIEYSNDATVGIYGCGFVWSESQEYPTMENCDNWGYSGSYSNENDYGYDYSYEMNYLEPNTTYYVRAFIETSMGNLYSESIVGFTTLEEETISGTENGYDYVDLGLSVKWATCNVGADSPEEYGDYYAWGETTTKAYYSSSNSATNGLSISELKSQGYIDSEGNLKPKYDAAQANWGGEWRMSTKEEQQELIDNCTWTWTSQNGVNGYKVTGPNGNSIFLPAAGLRNGSSLSNAGNYGYYWSSTPNDYGDYDAYYLDFDSSNHYMGSSGRGYGQSVRPVLE